MKVIKPYRFIPKEEIEPRAADVLMHVQAKRKRPLKWPIDAGHVPEALRLDMDCGDIPPDEPQQGIESKFIWVRLHPVERNVLY